ncbi:uncharacterized protein LTR77_010072 [Saxophila tyrrhenica]|uniref:Uncharacterized protein n=1 Tax=Saxophila tyrrhenica TaxID=1690608 RepID=A0AAV9NWU3_9PEZI|nr:hypothetical protein LTR77_010072 [Saxophila tyrrhenica]
MDSTGLRSAHEEADVSRQQLYERRVLLLPEGQTEEMLDERLRVAAKELGVEVMGLLAVSSPPKTKPESMRTFSSELPRRSESIDSEQSRFTGFTSNTSDLSRGQLNGRRPFRTSLSFKDYDDFLSRGRRDGRHKISFSPPSPPSRSTFSLPLYSPSPSPKKSFCHLRGLSMLKLRRTDSVLSPVGCPHCPREVQSRKRAQHAMPCGHRLCTPALRQTIQAATASKSGAVPSCCGIPIPGNLIEQAMTQEEQEAMLDKLEQWDEAASIAPSIKSEIGPPGVRRRPAPGGRTISDESRVDSVATNHTPSERLLERPEFQELQNHHNELSVRFRTWIEEHRALIQSTHDRLQTELKARQEAATEALVEHHANAMAEAEDKQVSAEANMRTAHEKEKRDHATALKHMEAYCAGTYANGEPHNRTITESDHSELTKARWVRDTMDNKHASVINVLRGDQARRMKMRADRQEREVQELKKAQRQEELEAARARTAEVVGLEGFVGERWRRIGVRWELDGAVFAKGLEVRRGGVEENTVTEDADQQSSLGSEKGVEKDVQPGAEQDLSGLAKMGNMYLGETAGNAATSGQAS